MTRPLSLDRVHFRRADDGSVWIIISDDLEDSEQEAVAVSVTAREANRIEKWLSATRGG